MEKTAEQNKGNRKVRRTIKVLTVKLEKVIHHNIKTGRSIDVTTICPLRAMGKPCPYCYVEAGRESGCNAKRMIEQGTYTGEILRLRVSTVLSLNRKGGLRMFASADYREQDLQILTQILDDCHTIGLKVKMITKQVDALAALHDHPAITVVNLSVDSVGGPISMAQALELKKSWHKVKIRIVALTHSDFLEMGPDADIITLYHGIKAKRNGWCTWRKNIDKDFVRNSGMTHKLCCATGKCSTCELKCGMVA